MGLELQYQPNAEQLALVGELESPLAELLPLTRAHLGGSEDAKTWRQIEELGLLAAGLDEARGGSGLGVTELVLIAMALGRNLASSAMLATLGAMGAAVELGASPRVAVGFAGDVPVWAEEPGATLLLLRSGDGASLHAMPKEMALADESSWGVRLMTGAVAPALRALDPREMRILRLIDAAALAGIAEAARDMAVDYAKLREQFGRPIGSFQAVKHHCANMAIAARGARDLTSFAAVAFDSERDDAAAGIESAFLFAAEAAIGNAGLNIQVHGGIGFSAEADPHLLLKRAQLLAALGGGAEAAAERVADASLPGR